MTNRRHPQSKFERIKVRKKFAPSSIRFDDKKKKEDERGSRVWRRLWKEQVKEVETAHEIRELAGV